VGWGRKRIFTSDLQKNGVYAMLFPYENHTKASKSYENFLKDMLTKNKKQRIIKEVKVHDTDTGSPEVQIAVLSRRIDDLAAHLKKNKKDKHSRRGLLGLVADRKAHMKYLEKKDTKRYNTLVKKLGLKKAS